MLRKNELLYKEAQSKEKRIKFQNYFEYPVNILYFLKTLEWNFVLSCQGTFVCRETLVKYFPLTCIRQQASEDDPANVKDSLGGWKPSKLNSIGQWVVPFCRIIIKILNNFQINSGTIYSLNLNQWEVGHWVKSVRIFNDVLVNFHWLTHL